MKNKNYDRGFLAGIDVALNLINTIDSNGESFRSELYKQLMEARPTEPAKARNWNEVIQDMNRERE